LVVASAAKFLAASSILVKVSVTVFFPSVVSGAFNGTAILIGVIFGALILATGADLAAIIGFETGLGFLIVGLETTGLAAITGFGAGFAGAGFATATPVFAAGAGASVLAEATGAGVTGLTGAADSNAIAAAGAGVLAAGEAAGFNMGLSAKSASLQLCCDAPYTGQIFDCKQFGAVQHMSNIWQIQRI
jgi:hypothetical protein